MNRILNVGCGNDTYGTDRIDIFPTSATTAVADLESKWPYENETFDIVYAKCILEHIRNLKNFSDECYRVLKPGGKLFIRTDYAGYIMFHISKAHEHNTELRKQYGFNSNSGFGHSGNEDFHYHLFIQSHLEGLFKKFKTKSFKYVVCGRNKLFGLILRLMPFKMGAKHIELEAIK
jgi:SAM-dependent methyltransferase